ncbi:MAG: hypothetical protein P8171_13100 [Candidatus Thiodiazotropha sp.]|jgi:hypothetical protein
MNNPHPINLLVISGIFSLLLCSCADNPSQESLTTNDFGTSQIHNEIDPQVAKHTCEAIAEELSNNDHHSLEERIDTIPIIAGISIAISHRPITLQQRRKIEQNLGGSVRRSLIPNIKQKQWAMRRGTIDSDHYLCLLRSNIESDDARYLEYELKKIDNQLKIVDLHYVERNLKISESFSSAFNDFIELFSTIQNGNHEQQETAKQELAKVTAFWNQVGNINPRGMQMAYYNLPARLKTSPVYIKITAASARSLDNASYMNFLKDIQKNLFYEADRFGLLLLDYYLEYNQYEQAKRLIRQFNDYVGPDAYFDLYLARLEIAQGNNKAFYHYCLQALEHESTYLDPYSFLLDQLVADHHFEDAVLVLSVLKYQFDRVLKEEHCDSSATYRKFCRSTEYLSWKQTSG